MASESPPHDAFLEEWTYDPLSADQLNYLDFLDECLLACNEAHAHACVAVSIADRAPERRPAYLIDVVQNCIIDVESVLGNAGDNQKQRYLALSYVWPKTPGASSLCLDIATLIRLTTPGSLQNLSTHEQIPAVIQHAIAFTIKLRERYLWVDRFCIVQDGPNLDSQIGHMDGIYGEAYLTIVAAGPDSMDHEWPSFKFPVPLGNTQESGRRDPVPKYLSAYASVATFDPAAILYERPLLPARAPQYRVSAYEHPEFERRSPIEKEPDEKSDDNCPVLALRQNSGAFAGLLRMMNPEKPPEKPLLLVAISAGSAMAEDLAKGREYNTYRKASFESDGYGSRNKYIFPEGDSALGCSLVDAFDNMGHRTGKSETLKRKSRISEDEWFESESEEKPESSLCKFYNVLWVEEIDGICYRRACGWVPEKIWEANATKRHVTLG
ncbi:hypothetical protein E8E13_001515 [Curvularia kusanoi]|uniref:Heterokaryon incompatibility domain-containing protein n=1 Tax=Curvularia kusanoi TaxID=90978 RepID=A0A9P4T4X5_CURKU|nr:hypothetical protein E8E13_001515 [Curvularia kusanoi]